MPISEVFSADIGLGGVLSLLWFRRRLPDYATKFIEMILMVRWMPLCLTAPSSSRNVMGWGNRGYTPAPRDAYFLSIVRLATTNLACSLPSVFLKFFPNLPTCIQVTADHGPAVSGAHNTIVTARAGKDLVSALCSGLLTIGPRFGGALDKAAEMFTQVCLVSRWVSQ